VKRYFLALGALMTALAAFAIPATADQPVAANQVAQAAPSPSPTPTPNPFQASGYLDTGYDMASVSGPGGALLGRVFDNLSGVPQLNDVNITAAYTGTIGAKVEINTGTDADVMHSYPQSLFICSTPPNCPAPLKIQADLTQAYASVSFSKFTLIAGKFETLAGAEVIESPSDLDFSRSIMFGQIPFTHTGARLTFAATPTLSLIGGINRGWDTTRNLSSADLAKFGLPASYSDNSNLTIEAGLAYNPSSVWGLTVQGYDGQQESGILATCSSNTGCNRTLIDAVGTYHVTSALTAIVNVDSARQTNTCSSSFSSGTGPNCVFFGGTGVGTVNWAGTAGYLSYVWSPAVTTTVRSEIFGDPQGYRTGIGGTVWKESTFTLQYAPATRLTLRGEYRVDSATQPIFASTTKPTSAFGTVGFEAIVHYP
jgi:hypothetical protein